MISYLELSRKLAYGLPLSTVPVLATLAPWARLTIFKNRILLVKVIIEKHILLEKINVQ